MRKYLLLTGSVLLVKMLSAQNVGIGTSNPQALLHVLDGSFVASTTNNSVNNPGPPPVSGSGKRMMWYADKAAFRVGGALSTSWNDFNIGNYSFAGGFNTIAKGAYSTAIGQDAIAFGQSSFAAGRDAISTGNQSISLGDATHSIGIGSVALGKETVAAGMNATSMGFGTYAAGNNSTAIGSETRASGSYSLAAGYSTTARAWGSAVFGYYNDSIIGSSPGSYVSSDPLFIIGNGTQDVRKNAVTILKNGSMGIGTNTPFATLDVNGSLLTNSLQVGNGTIITNMRSGTHTAGASASAQLTTTITFPANAFNNTPRLIATIRHDPAWNVSDVFTVLVKSISKTQAVLIIRRIDANAAWSQNLLVDYMAME